MSTAALAKASLALVVAAAALTVSVRDHSGSALPGERDQRTHSLALQAAVSSAVAEARPRFRIAGARDGLVARGGGLTTAFRPSGPDIRLPGGRVSFRLTGFGRHELAPVARPSNTVAVGNRVSYTRGALEEWYRNGPLGLEQGFTLFRRPSDDGALRLVMTTDGLAPRQTGSRIAFGNDALVYGGLGVVDAAQRSLPASLELSGRRVVIRVDDRHARYPITIDPFLQQGDRILAGGEIGNGWFGFRVALSADGNTALVGGHIDNGAKGAAWVFRRSGGIWTQEAKFAPLDEVGAGEFGSSVALSGDGNTALVGARSDANGKGAAWVYVSSPRTAPLLPWRRQAKLTADLPATAGEIKQFGASVALTDDGDTALIGAPLTQYSGVIGQGGLGAAWVFTRSAGTWTNRSGSFPLRTLFYSQTAQFGASVALAADGSVALVGAPGYAQGRGATFYFVHEGVTYLETSSNLAPPGNLTGSLGFGQSVALSDDGRTALVGAPLFGQGIAWAFVHEDCPFPPTGCWTLQRGFIPTDAEGNAQIGSSVALSADGDTALIGGPQDASGRGAMWAYVRSGPNWDQLGTTKVEAGGEVGAGWFANSVALAADGHSAFVGGPKHDGGVGAVWAFGDRPTVVSLAPGSGPTAGGTPVTMAGTGYKHASGVTFGSVAATSFEVLSPTLIRAVAPPHAAGTVDVAVSNSAGGSLPTAAGRYAYVAAGGSPPPPPPVGVSPTPPPAQDTKAPSTPGAFGGSFIRRTLFLRWKASRDDLGVRRYELFRDGVLNRKVDGKQTRTSIARFTARKRTLLTLQALDAAGNRSAAATLRVTPRARPAGVPRSIPGWARKLFAWQTAGQHGRRPATPKKLPAWYARWKAWKLHPYAFRN